MARAVVFRYGGIVLQFVILLVLARHLDADDYGRYMLVLSAVFPTYFLLGFGISEAFVREAPRLIRDGDLRPVRTLVGATLMVALGTAAVLAVAGALAVWLLPLDPTTSDVVVFMVAFFIANGLMFNGAQLLLGSGSETLGAFFFYPAINLSLVVSALPYVLYSAHPTFSGIALATSVASLIVGVVAVGLVVVHVRPRRPRRGTSRQLIAVGARLSAARGMYAAGLWLPTFIAGVLLAPAQAGYLGTAGRLAVAVGAVTAAVRFAIRPAIVRAYERQDWPAIAAVCGRVATVTLAMVTVAFAVTFFFGRSLVSMTFGTGFASAAPLLTVLLIGVAIEAFAGPVDEVLKMTGQENSVLIIFAGTLPIFAAALVAAAPHGVMVMAWVQVGYTLAVFGAMIVTLGRKRRVWLHPVAPPILKGNLRQRQSPEWRWPWHAGRKQPSNAKT